MSDVADIIILRHIRFHFGQPFIPVLEHRQQKLLVLERELLNEELGCGVMTLSLMTQNLVGITVGIYAGSTKSYLSLLLFLLMFLMFSSHRLCLFSNESKVSPHFCRTGTALLSTHIYSSWSSFARHLIDGSTSKSCTANLTYWNHA